MILWKGQKVIILEERNTQAEILRSLSNHLQIQRIYTSRMQSCCVAFSSSIHLWNLWHNWRDENNGTCWSKKIWGTELRKWLKPSYPTTGNHNHLTFLFTFPVAMTRRICLTITSVLNWWSWQRKEKLEARQSTGL